MEQFVSAKHAGRASEDAIGDFGMFVVVADGVTGKSGATYDGRTGGRFAAEHLLAMIGSLPADITARHALDSVTASLHDTLLETAGTFPADPPGATVAVYSSSRREVWRVGDIHVRIGPVSLPSPAPPTDAIAVAFRAALLEACLAGGATEAELVDDDPSWAAMLPLLSRQHIFANRPDRHPLGYGVVNGTTVPDHHVEVFPVVPGSEVVFASDGYLDARGTLDNAERDLVDVLTSDRLLIRRHQAFRPAPVGGSFDDRAWIRFVTAA